MRRRRAASWTRGNRRKDRAEGRFPLCPVHRSRLAPGAYFKRAPPAAPQPRWSRGYGNEGQDDVGSTYKSVLGEPNSRRPRGGARRARHARGRQTTRARAAAARMGRRYGQPAPRQVRGWAKAGKSPRGAAADGAPRRRCGRATSRSARRIFATSWPRRELRVQTPGAAVAVQGVTRGDGGRRSAVARIASIDF